MKNRFGSPFRNEHPAKQRLQKYVRGNSGITPPDEDPRYELIGVTDPDDRLVNLAVQYRGYVCKRRNPNGYWTIDAAIDGSELPPSFAGSFTGKHALFAVIDKHLDTVRS